MRDILDAANRPILSQIAWSNALLAFDYDGTLAPIVSDPDEAWMRDRTRLLLERLARAYPCAVISGRSQRDSLRRLRGTGVLEVIGNHGLEPWRRTVPFLAAVDSWAAALRAALADIPGVVVENKDFSVAVHYRNASDRRLARAAILTAVAMLDDVRVIGGKCVVNVLPRGAPHKGTALEATRDQLGCDVALYVGDDETDEDVFALDAPGRLLSIRVGRKPTSRASYFIPDQNGIDDLLAVLIQLRADLQR
jgi:trehalose 6-phosphate phosphatase